MKVLFAALFLTSFLVGCSGDETVRGERDDDSGAGGVTSSGGRPASGGTPSSGGTPASGGTSSSGGAEPTDSGAATDASEDGSVPPPDASDRDAGSDAGAIDDFSEGFDGWKAVELTSSGAGDGYGVVLSTVNDLVWNPTGGNPGGYLSRIDTTVNSFFFDAPPKYLGDLTRYAGGTLTFFLKSTHATWLDDSVVVLVGGPNNRVIVSVIAAPATAWTAYSVPLAAASFLLGTQTGTVVSEEVFDEVITDVRALRINGEWGAQVQETVGFDTVELNLP